MRAFTLSTLGLVTGAVAKGVWTTPHDKYSSSVGVLGCKINTNRVAYWPGSIDCDNICVKLSYEGRSLHLLRIDQSGGAYDISYDAWAYLQTGNAAAQDPISGGTVAMEYEEVDASECADLIYTKGSKLPLSASNSINYLSSCLDQPNSWVAKNHVLFNICDAICSVGFDEECDLDLSISNQPSCPHTLGLTSKLTSAPVYDIEYSTGRKLVAGSGEEAPAGSQDETPKKEAVGEEAPKKEAAKEEIPKDAAKEEAPKDETPKVEAPKEIVEQPGATTTSIPATTHQVISAPSTSASAGGDNGAIFQEVTSSSKETAATSDVPSSAVVPSTTLVAPTSSHETIAISESSTSEAQLPTSSPVSSTVSSNTTTISWDPTSSHSFIPSTKTLTTLTFSTTPTGSNPIDTGNPPVQESPRPDSAGQHAASVPILAMVLGVVCSLSSLL
jgi:hypothetical protein